MSAPHKHAVLHGIYLKLSALVLFCTMDAMVKALGGTYGAFQLMLFRSAIAMVPVAVLIWRAGGLKIVRANRPRWSAVAVGFAGVLIMLDPWGIEFHAISLIVLAATFCYALSTILVRLLSRHDHDVVSLFWFSLAASAVSLIGAIPEWKWPTPMDWVWLILLGLLGGVAQILITRAWRLAPAAVLAPFDYASIVLAVLFGYLWFKEEPSWTVWFGLPLVMGSGLYILHRERVRARERDPVTAP